MESVVSILGYIWSTSKSVQNISTAGVDRKDNRPLKITVSNSPGMFIFSASCGFNISGMAQLSMICNDTEFAAQRAYAGHGYTHLNCTAMVAVNLNTINFQIAVAGGQTGTANNMGLYVMQVNKY